MSTRAQIAVLDLPNGMVKTVYNHYDGGADLKDELNTHFNADNLAQDLVNKSSIRAVADGEAEYYNDGGADILTKGNLDDLAMDFAEHADEVSAQWIHFWDGRIWNTIKHRGIRDTYEELLNLWDVKEAKTMDESYDVKWKKFLSEGDKIQEGLKFDVNTIKDYIAKEEGPQGESDVNIGLEAYIESLERDIAAERSDAYSDYSLEDFYEDYENYVADKMDM